MFYQSINDHNFFNKRVLIRLDLNVPMLNGEIIDATRIEKAIPSLNSILKDSPRYIAIISHLGRPSKNLRDRSKFSLQKVADILSKKINKDVIFETQNISQFLQQHLLSYPSQSIIMLENIRFYEEEENNNDEFSKLLSNLGDIFVNDAFSCSHRSHSSIVGVAKYLKSLAGLLLDQEVKTLNNLLLAPQQPVIGIVAGSKVSTKIDLLKNMISKLDYLFVGGGMANNLLVAQGYAIGKSFVEEKFIDISKEILDYAAYSSCQLILPEDVVVADKLEKNVSCRNTLIHEVLPHEAIYDVGYRTIAKLENILKKCKMVLWNGPIGVYEITPFDRGSLAVAKIICNLTASNAIKSIVGGGDTAAIIAQYNLVDNFSYISTAGGAFLDYLEGKILPGIKALEN